MWQIDSLRATKPEIHEGLGPLRISLERAIQAVRDITRGPAEPTDSASLLTAIQQALANSPWADYPLQCDLDPELSKMTATQAPLAVRAICELVGNAHRHAYAGVVRLRVWCQNDALHIWVDDDGIGIADANNHQHFGLRSLHYQVASEGGHLHLHAKPGIGTHIALVFPLRHTRLVSTVQPLRDQP
jgi:signal transduction histidine kinase